MATILTFPDHARASSGHKSGRNSVRETPVSRSIDKTNSAGTPRLDRESQYQTCDCVVPMRSAKGFCPPAKSQARFSASVDMEAHYPNLGKNQPINLSGTANLNFGIIPPMGREADKKAFGARAKRRREAIGVSQTDIGEAIGMSQQGVDNIESGKVSRPRLLPELAESLQTTIKWLLYEEGPEVVSPPDQRSEITSIFQTVDNDKLGVVLRLLKTLSEKKTDVA